MIVLINVYVIYTHILAAMCSKGFIYAICIACEKPLCDLEKNMTEEKVYK